jgi:hypothetical protein
MRMRRRLDSVQEGGIGAKRNGGTAKWNDAKRGGSRRKAEMNVREIQKQDRGEGERGI